MGQKVIYDHTGTVVRVLHASDKSDFFADFAVETLEDVEPLLDSVKVLRDDHRQGGDWKHVARLPVTVIEQAMREGWMHDDARWKQFFNDPDNKHLRVWEGRV
jgi:hypothetical protein